MRLRRYAIILIVLALLVGAVTLVTALSPGYSINSHTHTANAGGISTGANYQVRGTLGQPAVQVSSGTSYRVSSGIWTRADTGTRVYLPMVLKHYDASGLIPGDVSDTCPGYSISVGRQVRENFDHDADKDWYTFGGAGGTSYDLETFDLQSTTDVNTILFVFWGELADGCPDAAIPGDVYCPSDTCKRISTEATVPDCACNTNCAGGPHSCFTWEAPTSRDYRVYVRNWDWHSKYGSNTHYSLRVSVNGGGALQGAGVPTEAGLVKPPGER